MQLLLVISLTAEWSLILLPTKVHLILETWWYTSLLIDFEITPINSWITWIHCHGCHCCSYWCPGAEAPGHLYPQCWINFHVLNLFYTFTGNNIKCNYILKKVNGILYHHNIFSNTKLDFACVVTNQAFVLLDSICEWYPVYMIYIQSV